MLTYLDILFQHLCMMAQKHMFELINLIEMEIEMSVVMTAGFRC